MPSSVIFSLSVRLKVFIADVSVEVGHLIVIIYILALCGYL